MGLETLLRGLVIGFSIAAPVGPIGVLCIRRTLADGRAIGLAVGLGAAAADAVYGAVAGFGLTAVSEPPRRASEGLLCAWSAGCFSAISAFAPSWRGPPTARPVRAGPGILGAFAATFGLTLANPATILSFVAVFAGFGHRRRGKLARGGGPRGRRLPGLGPLVADAQRRRRRSPGARWTPALFAG